MIDRDALGFVPKPDQPFELRCTDCGTTDGLHADAGLVMCGECFDETFPELERPPKLADTAPESADSSTEDER